MAQTPKEILHPMPVVRWFEDTPQNTTVTTVGEIMERCGRTGNIVPIQELFKTGQTNFSGVIYATPEVANRIIYS